MHGPARRPGADLPHKADDVQTPIVTKDNPDQNIVFTQYDMTTKETALKALAAAQHAYMFGRRTWARMSIPQRCTHMEHFADDLEKKTDEIAALLRWEIAKSVKDSKKDEVVRTVSYIRNTIREAKALFDAESSWQEAKGVLAQIRHLPIGVVLASSVIRSTRPTPLSSLDCPRPAERQDAALPDAGAVRKALSQRDDSGSDGFWP